MHRPLENPLDNPLWASLTTTHRSLAAAAPDRGVLRYPRDVAPFLAVERGGERVEAELAQLVEPGETVFLIGPRPAVPGGWVLEDFGTITQMVADGDVPRVDGPPVEELAADGDSARVRELAALVYPHYFRPRTAGLGRYFGVRERVEAHGRRLAAMAGERMGFPGYREISAVCTHPDHVGRGLARRVLGVLAAEIRARGEVPFLHVGPANTRAIALYEQNRFVTRVAIAFAGLRRP